MACLPFVAFFVVGAPCLVKLVENCFQAERGQRLHDHLNPRFEPRNALRRALLAAQDSSPVPVSLSLSM